MKIFYIEPVPGMLKGFEKRFNEVGISIAENLNSADVVISAQLNPLLNIPVSSSQKRLVWTNEARWSSEIEHKIYYKDQEIHIMNAHNESVFLDPFHYLWTAKYKHIPPISLSDYKDRLQKSSKPIFMMASNHGDGKDFIINGKNIDLYRHRYDLAKFCWMYGYCDIYGSGWPDHVSCNDKGRGKREWNSWEEEKLSISNRYLYNICIENTNSKYYITEKLWHSIMSKNLPVYYCENTGLSEIFDTSAFVDTSIYSTYEETLDAILEINSTSYLERMNYLIETFNKYVVDPQYLARSRDKVFETVKNYLESVS